MISTFNSPTWATAPGGLPVCHLAVGFYAVAAGGGEQDPGRGRHGPWGAAPGPCISLPDYSLVIGDIEPLLLAIIKDGPVTKLAGVSSEPLTWSMMQDAILEMEGLPPVPVDPAISRDPFVVGVDLLWLGR